MTEPEPAVGKRKAGNPVAGLIWLVPICRQIAYRTASPDDDAAVAFLEGILRAANPREVVDTLLALAAAPAPDTGIRGIVPRPPE